MRATITMETPLMESVQGRLFNIASYLPRMADRVPNEPAVTVTRRVDRAGRAEYVSLTFAELEALSNRFANGLGSAGFRRGARVLMMVRPGFDFVGLVFALFKIGAVPVMIDPGMGVRRMLECIRQVDLDGFIGIPIAHAIRVLRRRHFETVERFVTVGRRWFWGGPTLRKLSRGASERFTPVDTASTDAAAILFTSGSTGPAKGVVYEHGMFGAQVEAIQSQYGIQPGEVDLPTFPLFALFSVAMGMTVVIPEMDPSRPVRADPAKLVRAIHDRKVTSTFGSPALWTRVAGYCSLRGIKLPSLRRILIAGAPVPVRVIKTLRHALDEDADVHTPYGATESLPVSSISGRELLETGAAASGKGAGTCVGQPLGNIDLRIIRIQDDPIAEWFDDLLVPDGERGEIVVAGPVVTKCYFGLDQATRSAKILEGDRVWHRIGDIGYRDREGRVWFCGRKSQRVVTSQDTLFADQCEAVFNEHPDVRRTALVGVGDRGSQKPVLVVEPAPDRFPDSARRPKFCDELLKFGKACELTKAIEDVLFHRSLPVDVRHNAKIKRELLTVWAGERIR